MKKKKCFIIIIMTSIVCYLYYTNYPIIRYSNEDFNIIDYYSENDEDGDGINDQRDILLGSKDYLDTKPRYKSKYYSTGYSNDQYGVCTDVVANAMLQAGYDLMNLVDEDIKNNRDDYNIDKLDKCIDFRRVVNLDVYFKNNAIILTTDIYDIESWQGGDIVVFEGHIGVVSDIRNALGIPYILHHSDPLQIFYEEDILEMKQSEIIGHYRVV